MRGRPGELRATLSTAAPRVPSPEVPTVPSSTPALVDERGLAAAIKSSTSTIERLLLEGLPCIDIGPVSSHHPKRRRRRTLRFDVAEVIGWLRTRGRSGEGSAPGTVDGR